jgi:hypothetical protein
MSFDLVEVLLVVVKDEPAVLKPLYMLLKALKAVTIEEAFMNVQQVRSFHVFIAIVAPWDDIESWVYEKSKRSFLYLVFFHLP